MDEALAADVVNALLDLQNDVVSLNITPSQISDRLREIINLIPIVEDS